MQLFEKMQCFYIVTVHFNVSICYLLCKIGSCSCKKAAQKLAKTVGKLPLNSKRLKTVQLQRLAQALFILMSASGNELHQLMDDKLEGMESQEMYKL